MKMKLKKNLRSRFMVGGIATVVTFAILMAVSAFLFLPRNGWMGVMFFCYMMFSLKAFLDPYQITDNNQLVGNGVIHISLILRIERKEKGGFRIWYTWMEGGKERSRSFYPADEPLFISTLQQINPNIKLT